MGPTQLFMHPAATASIRRSCERPPAAEAAPTDAEPSAFGIRHSTFGAGSRLLFLPVTPLPPVPRETEPV